MTTSRLTSPMSLYSLSSPVLTSESIPSSTSTRVSQDFNEWYQGLGIHSVYEEDLDSPEKERCLKEWVKDKPISVRGLDRVDRVVLKIAGQYFSTNVSLVFSSCNVICNEISRQYLMWVPDVSAFEKPVPPPCALSCHATEYLMDIEAQPR